MFGDVKTVDSSLVSQDVYVKAEAYRDGWNTVWGDVLTLKIAEKTREEILETLIVNYLTFGPVPTGEVRREWTNGVRAACLEWALTGRAWKLDDTRPRGTSYYTDRNDRW